MICSIAMSQTQVSAPPADTTCLPPFTPLDQQVLEEYHNHFFKQGSQPDPARLRELVRQMQGYNNYLDLFNMNATAALHLAAAREQAQKATEAATALFTELGEMEDLRDSLREQLQEERATRTKAERVLDNTLALQDRAIPAEANSAQLNKIADSNEFTGK